MSTRPMTVDQRELIETLRKQQNISAEVWDQLCQKLWEVPYDEINIRQASAMITSLKTEKPEIRREVQILAGQRSLL